MSVTASVEQTGRVNSMHLADGKLVQLSGYLGTDEAAALRLALLMPLPEDCRDVVVDAGGVVDVTDDSLAVLLAARAWAEENGVRFLLSRTSHELDDVLDALDLSEEFPRLRAVRTGTAGQALAAVPGPRAAAD